MQFRTGDIFMTKIVFLGILDFQREQKNYYKTTYIASLLVDGNENGHSRNFSFNDRFKMLLYLDWNTCIYLYFTVGDEHFGF